MNISTENATEKKPFLKCRRNFFM